MKTTLRMALLIVTIVLPLCVPRVARAFVGPKNATCSYAGCPSTGPVVTNPQGNGYWQNPEIILIFWQDSGADQWTNTSSGQSPTMSQVVGASLSITNSTYFGGLEEYGGNDLTPEAAPPILT